MTDQTDASLATIAKLRVEAQAINRAGDMKLAFHKLDQAETLAYQNGTPQALGLVWRGRANVFKHRNQLLDALSAANTAADYYAQADLPYEVAVTQIINVAALGSLERFDEMFSLAAQIRPILAANPLHLAMLELTIGNKCAWAWHNQEALRAYQIARRNYQQLNQPLWSARIVHNMGLVLLQMGDLEQAQDHLEQARTEFAEIDDPASAVKLQLSLATLYAQQGLYQKALDTVFVARALLETTPDPLDRAAVDIQEARIRRTLNQQDTAIVLLRNALVLYEKRGAAIMLAETLIELAHVLLDNPSHSHLLESLDALERAEKLLLQLDVPLLLAQVRLNQGELLHNLGRDGAAAAAAKKACTVFEAHNLPLYTGQVLALMADCQQQLDSQSATIMYHQALEWLDGIEPLTIVRCHAGLGQLAAGNDDYVSAQYHFTAAFDLLDSMRRNFNTHRHQAGFLADKQLIGEELLSVIHAQSDSNERLLRWVERLKARALADLLSGGLTADAEIDRELQRLLTERETIAQRYDLRSAFLATSSGSKLATTHPNATVLGQQNAHIKAELADLRRQIEHTDALIDRYNNAAYAWRSGRDASNVSIHTLLNSDTVFISYYVADNQLHALTATSDVDSLVTKPLNVSLATIRKAWQQSRRRVIRPKSRPADVQQRLGQLYNWLLAPLHSEIGDHKRLIIVPHSSLFHIPFAGLFDRSIGQYAIERWSIQIVPSATIWQHCRQLPTGTRQPLLLGYPGQTDQVDYLPDVTAEIETLAALLPTADTLKNDRATQRALLEQMPQRSFVHLAGHIFYDLADSLASGMPLADGRWLRASDLYLRFGQLGGATVVLSGCESARVQSLGGDVLGLTSAFFYAGATGLVAGLWKIDDAATAQLMTTFYEALLDGNDSAEALRYAQRALLNSDTFNQPYYWAAFTLNGDARKLI